MHGPTIYAFSLFPTPAYNTENFPDFYKEGQFPIDEKGLFRNLEFIARVGTFFHVLQIFQNYVWKVETRDYPTAVFVDARFLQITDRHAGDRIEKLPTEREILKRLEHLSSLKLKYLWGGGSQGIPQMSSFYAMPNDLEEKMKQIWMKQGYDCTGLVYEVTNGMSGNKIAMPRNSGDQIKLGKGLPIKGKSDKQIASMLKPLDLIGWKGHVILIGRNGSVIESHRLYGVVKTPTLKRLQEIMATRTPVDTYTSPQDQFVIRRWYPQTT